MQYIKENDDEQITMSDLIKKMDDILEGSNCTPYSFPYMKDKLKEYFGPNIVITELNGKANVVTLQSTADSVVYSFYQQQKAEDSNTEAVRLVETAAKLIRNDIKAVEMCNESYPTNDQMGSTEEALKFFTIVTEWFPENPIHRKKN